MQPNIQPFTSCKHTSYNLLFNQFDNRLNNRLRRVQKKPVVRRIDNRLKVCLHIFALLTAKCTYTLQGAATFPLQIAPFRGYLDPHLMHGSCARPSPQTKRYLDRFSHFAGLTTVTDRPTDHATRSEQQAATYVVSGQSNLT